MKAVSGKHKKVTYRVYQGDCVKLLEQIPAGSIPLGIVDPPFNIGWKGYDSYDDNRTSMDYLAWCSVWLTHMKVVLSETGTLWVCIGDEFVSELDVLAKEHGFFKRSHVVHYYTFGVACTKNFARSHTHLLYYTRHKTKFTFNADSKKLRVPSARQLVYNDARANPAGKLPDNTWVLSPLDLSKTFTRKEDTWLESRICGNYKERSQVSTQMPLAVLRRMIESTSKPGDNVLDPMAGSFAAGEAALELGRNFIGMELSENYAKEGAKRLRSLS